jgi:sugar lactone lactonase YvrE
LGESPLWDPIQKVLYWVDLEDDTIFRFDPKIKSLEKFPTQTTVGSMGLRFGGGLILATQKGFAFWVDKRHELAFMNNFPEDDRPGARFNDGAVDRKGRFWAGTTKKGSYGSLFRLDTDGKVHRMDTGFFGPNGIGWSLDNKTMYFTESRIKCIHKYDFDIESGNISNRRIFIHNPEDPGIPDGLTVDQEGFIWSVRFGGWKITRYDPQGKMEREIILPVECPTSCIFGGEKLDELYVTSSLTWASPGLINQQPLAGDIFALHTGVCGIAEPNFLG